MQKELRVGLDFAAPVPLHTDISSSTFEGFEVDLVSVISEKLGLKITYEVSLWEGILQKLKEGHIDVICSAVTVTPERKYYLDFSEPYLSFRLCTVSYKEDDIYSLDDLKSKKIGVRKATEAENYIKARLKESRLVYSDTNEELYQMLNQRKIDLLVDDSPIAGAFVKLNDKLNLSLFLPGTESQYAIALRKDNTPVKNEINNVLREIKKNGSWQILYDKWFNGAVL